MSQFYVAKLLLDLIYHFPLALPVSVPSFLYTSKNVLFGMHTYGIYDSPLDLNNKVKGQITFIFDVEQTYDREKA